MATCFFKYLVLYLKAQYDPRLLDLILHLVTRVNVYGLFETSYRSFFLGLTDCLRLLLGTSRY